MNDFYKKLNKSFKINSSKKDRHFPENPFDKKNVKIDNKDEKYNNKNLFYPIIFEYQNYSSLSNSLNDISDNNIEVNNFKTINDLKNFSKTSQKQIKTIRVYRDKNKLKNEEVYYSTDRNKPGYNPFSPSKKRLLRYIKKFKINVNKIEKKDKKIKNNVNDSLLKIMTNNKNNDNYLTNNNSRNEMYLLKKINNFCSKDVIISNNTYCVCKNEKKNDGTDCKEDFLNNSFQDQILIKKTPNKHKVINQSQNLIKKSLNKIKNIKIINNKIFNKKKNLKIYPKIEIYKSENYLLDNSFKIPKSNNENEKSSKLEAGGIINKKNEILINEFREGNKNQKNSKIIEKEENINDYISDENSLSENNTINLLDDNIINEVEQNKEESEDYPSKKNFFEKNLSKKQQKKEKQSHEKNKQKIRYYTLNNERTIKKSNKKIRYITPIKINEKNAKYFKVYNTYYKNKTHNNMLQIKSYENKNKSDKYLNKKILNFDIKNSLEILLQNQSCTSYSTITFDYFEKNPKELKYIKYKKGNSFNNFTKKELLNTQKGSNIKVFINSINITHKTNVQKNQKK